MVDAVVSVFLEKLLTSLATESSIVFEFKDEFEKLKNELLLLQSFLKDAEKLKRRHDTLRTIMAHLRELIYEAEDILADCDLRSNHHHIDATVTCSSRCFFSPSQLPFRYLAGKRLKEINDKITNIKQNISSYLGVPLFNHQISAADAYKNQIPRWSSPLYDHNLVVGLEGDTYKIKQWLFNPNDDDNNNNNQLLVAIGVVGMGGVGKTTVAQKVFDDRQVEDHYDRRMWVSVTQTFTEEQIMRSMLKNLGDASGEDDRGELLRRINQYLQGKKYLIVVDDVWSKDTSWWVRISQGLPKGNRSAVLITTRNEEVALKMGVAKDRVHRPKLLSEENSWLLFRKIAFAGEGGECIYPDLEGVGEEIVNKCKGLPLAIKAVAGIMLCKPPHFFEWKRIAENLREELAEHDDSVKASLQLSYDELPSYLKQCLLCFSLYPEDCVIKKEQLMHWWIGEGFVPVRKGRLATEAGEDCFSGLMNRCLIEAVDRRTYNGKVDTCRMHDMVRDLVIRLADEDAFSTSSNGGLNSRRLGINKGHFDPPNSLLSSNLKLRALMSTKKTGEVNKIASSEAKKLCGFQYLRVLDLSKSIFQTHIASVLSQTGSLRHLTYLSLSSTHPLIQVPASIENLSNLQILDVSSCQNLKKLPPRITTLEKLIVLDVSNCGSLEYLPRGLERLSNLQVLLGFRPARPCQSPGCRIAELKRLTKLRTLGLQLTRGDEIGEEEVNVLQNLHQLQFLTISCFDGRDSDLIAKLDKLVPPIQLHELSLKFFPGNTSPSWLTPSSLPMLRHLSITSGNLAKMSRRFWASESEVWKVEGLMLESLLDLEAQWPLFQQAMPLLRVMAISWCPKLESFPIEEVAFRGGAWKKEEDRT